DPFLGSGSTAIAALRRKRHFIGVEIHPEYASAAGERIREVQAVLL
ncbi:MAG: DNA methyltransferase, partial [Bacteroidia bacterium]|nr:DNA methyltransferase [Bacteroidia bacterium]